MTHSILRSCAAFGELGTGFLSTAVRAWPWALICLAVNPQAAHSADKDKGQQISRVIAKEMTAAQKALQANQWAEALKNLEAAANQDRLDRRSTRRRFGISRASRTSSSTI